MEAIRSTKNPRLKRLRELRRRKAGEPLLIEGRRLVDEALAAGRLPSEVWMTERYSDSESAEDLWRALERHAQKTGRQIPDRFLCSEEAFGRITALDSPPGILAVLPEPSWEDDAFFAGDSPFLCIAAGVRDPGNLGGLVRSAEAAGATGFLSLEGSADPFRDKALRGSSGSALRLPCRGSVAVPELLEWKRRFGLRLIGVDAHRGEDLWEASFEPFPVAFVLGAEGAGLPAELLKACDGFLRIPIQSPVESLNVSVAAGLVLFEQRRRVLSKER